MDATIDKRRTSNQACDASWGMANATAVASSDVASIVMPARSGRNGVVPSTRALANST